MMRLTFANTLTKISNAKGKSMKFLLLTLLVLSVNLSAMADTEKPLAGSVSDPFVEAQEKLLHAKGSYKTIRQQETAIQDIKKATRLSLKAAKLRANAEKLQTKADILVTRANQQALSKGLYITNPLGPVMMQAPPAATAQDQTAKAPSFVPVPGQPINIIIPKQEEVSQNSVDNPEPPTLNNF